ncbi:hypothetical protein GWN26_03430 [Candidatus Saccharibacteria bacterium]|nr:hypothetical protein [Candidatus Saccharibacteria bacterium]
MRSRDVFPQYADLAGKPGRYFIDQTQEKNDESRVEEIVEHLAAASLLYILTRKIELSFYASRVPQSELKEERHEGRDS